MVLMEASRVEMVEAVAVEATLTAAGTGPPLVPGWESVPRFKKNLAALTRFKLLPFSLRVKLLDNMCLLHAQVIMPPIKNGFNSPRAVVQLGLVTSAPTHSVVVRGTKVTAHRG